jgi:hypothetical protein
MLMTALNEEEIEIMSESINEDSITISDIINTDITNQSHTSSTTITLINIIIKNDVRFKHRKTISHERVNSFTT